MEEIINRKRRQLIVHSTIYYNFNRNIITDSQFDGLCVELVELQATYPEIAEGCVYADLFRGFTGATGMHLANEAWGISTAEYILRLHGQKVDTE